MINIVLTNRLPQTDLDVIECGTQKCHPGYSFGPAIRDFYIIHYIHSGQGYFRLENKEFSLGKGDAFLICPDVITHYYADATDPWNYSWVGFHGTKAEFYLRQANLSIENPILHCRDHGYMDDCFAKMMRTRDIGRSRETQLLGLLYLLLSSCIEQVSGDFPSNAKRDGKAVYISKAVEFIKVNYSKKISIPDIADHVGLDSKYLCAVFKSSLETSPHKFLLNVRLDRACDLMRNQTLTIGDISRSVGYEDPLLFSKMFRKYKGCSPREFKKNFGAKE